MANRNAHIIYINSNFNELSPLVQESIQNPYNFFESNIAVEKQFPPHWDLAFFHFDANDESTILKDTSNRVSSWIDTRQHAEMLVNATYGYPTYQSASLNGKPSVYFLDNMHLYLNTTITSSIYHFFTIVGVFFVQTSSADFQFNHPWSFVGSGAPSVANFLYLNDDTNNLYIERGGLGNWYTFPYTNIINSGSWKMFCGYIDESNNVALRYNGIFVTASFPPYIPVSMSITTNGTGHQNKIGSSILDYNDHFVGNIAEILVFTSSLTTTQVLEIENYLNIKWKVF